MVARAVHRLFLELQFEKFSQNQQITLGKSDKTPVLIEFPDIVQYYREPYQFQQQQQTKDHTSLSVFVPDHKLFKLEAMLRAWRSYDSAFLKDYKKARESVDFTESFVREKLRERLE